MLGPRLCKNIVTITSQLTHFSENLPHNSEVWGSINIAAVAVSKKRNT